MFRDELQVALGHAARMGGGITGGVLPGSAVHGAQAMVFEDRGDPIVTWTSVVEDAVVVLCTFCGVLGHGVPFHTGLDLEHPQLRAACQLSSTCRHAAALIDALNDLAADIGAADFTALFTALPLLLGPAGDDDDPDDASTKVYFAKMMGRRGKVPVFAVLYEGIWAPVIVRPTGNRLKLATCSQLSCQTQPWGCIHAKAVNRHNRIASSDATTREMRRVDGQVFGADGILNDGADSAGGARAPSEAPRADPVAPEPERQRRRARNMFPCPGEIKLCAAYHALCDRLRASESERYVDVTHKEKRCLACGALASDAAVESSMVALYTLRGRLTTTVGKWTCSCGETVLYDGAEDGLFAASPEVVYVRIFMDAVLEICVISRSTMAAAAEYLTSLLRNTGAYEDGEHGQVRQLLSDAVGEFSDTLVIPEKAFACASCGENEANGGEFKVVLADGQIASVLQEHVLPMMRPGMNLPKAEFSITYACAVQSYLIRNLIRRRCRLRADAAVLVSQAEATAWGQFAAQHLTAPPSQPPLPSEENPSGRRTMEEQSAALTWATSALFTTFFTVHAAGAVAANAGARVRGPLRAERRVLDGDGDGLGAQGHRLAGDRRQEAGSESDADTVNLLSDADSDSDGGDAYGVAESSSSDYSSIAIGSNDGNGVEQDGGLPFESPVDGGEEQESLDGPAEAAQQSNDADILNVLQCLELVDRPAVPAEAAQEPSPAPSADVGEFLLSAPGSLRSGPVHESSASPAVRSALAATPGADAVEPTRDLWRVPMTSIEPHVPGRPPSESSVVVDCCDFVSPLTLAAVKETNKAVFFDEDDNSVPSVTVFGIPLTKESFRTLLPGKWLNDEIINGFVQLVRERHGCRADTAAGPLMVLNSFFLLRLLHRGVYDYEGVRRWTRNVDIFKKDKVFIPINMSSSHWMLAVLEPGRCVSNLYDSLGNTRRYVPEMLLRWIADEAASRIRPMQPWRVEQVPCRQQENGDDCGVFTLKVLDLLAQGRPLTELKASTAYYRRRIAAELIAGTL